MSEIAMRKTWNEYPYFVIDFIHPGADRYHNADSMAVLRDNYLRPVPMVGMEWSGAEANNPVVGVIVQLDGEDYELSRWQFSGVAHLSEIVKLCMMTPVSEGEK